MKKNNKKENTRRAAYEARQEEQGKNVVKIIFGVLMVIALCFMAYSMYVIM